MITNDEGTDKTEQKLSFDSKSTRNMKEFVSI